MPSGEIKTTCVVTTHRSEHESVLPPHPEPVPALCLVSGSRTQYPRCLHPPLAHVPAALHRITPANTVCPSCTLSCRSLPSRPRTAKLHGAPSICGSGDRSDALAQVMPPRLCPLASRTRHRPHLPASPGSPQRGAPGPSLYMCNCHSEPQDYYLCLFHIYIYIPNSNTTFSLQLKVTDSAHVSFKQSIFLFKFF